MKFKRHLASLLPTFRGKLIFIAGPRQSGKTFLVKHTLKPDLELNMDVSSDRLHFKKMPEEMIAWYERERGPFPKTNSPRTKPLVFIDEIQKVQGWRNLIKGIYDKTHHAIDYVASGSSAFGLRKQDKGDSLAGRAVWLTLFPLSFREYVQSLHPGVSLPPPWKGHSSLLDAIRSVLPHQKLLRTLWNDYSRYGSFPENLLRKDDTFLKQWLSDYQAALLDRDLKDLNLGKDVERIYQTYELLLEGLGSTYSLRSISETLGVSPNTVKSDVRALKQVLWGYELSVCQLSKAKQIRKEKKFFPIDFSFTHYHAPMAEGAEFESQVACLLQRGLWSEISGVLSSMQLGFYRSYQKHEVDFLVRDKNNILLMIECKRKLKQHTDGLLYAQAFKPLLSLQVVEEENIFDIRSPISAVSIELLATCLE